MKSKTEVAFIGLGNMGRPMAKHVADSDDIELTVVNRTVSKATDFASEVGCNYAKESSGIAESIEVAVLCVTDDEQVKNVTSALAGLSGSLKAVIDHTTTSPMTSEWAANLLGEQGIEYIDAPVSGGVAGAEKGSLSVMMGGKKDIVDKYEFITSVYSGKATLFGNVGSGQKAKAVNQILISNIVQGLSEGILLGEAMGLDMSLVLDALAGGAAQSWQLENRGPTMLDRKFDFGFAVKHITKDLRIVLETLDHYGVQGESTRHILDRYESLMEGGRGDDDFTALVEVS